MKKNAWIVIAGGFVLIIAGILMHKYATSKEKKITDSSPEPAQPEATQQPGVNDNPRSNEPVS